MEAEEKFKILSEDARFDCEALGNAISHQHIHTKLLPYISYVSAGSKKIPLLKVLLTNFCLKDCRYCAVSSKITGRIIKFTPLELAQNFLQMHKKSLVRGLFLSSGIIKSPDYTMELLNHTARLLRKKFGYRGYIHLKVMPGASKDSVDEAARFADRISVNLEAPNPRRLCMIAPSKDIKKQMLPLLQRMKELYEEGAFPAGIITQFVAGASLETDRELLSTASFLYRKYKLRRAYYSGFEPIKGTPMEEHPPTLLLRQNRLYQADFLIRFYGFDSKELSFDSRGNLLLDMDPKLAWATSPENQKFFPVEINTAPYEMLLRVPGIGPKGARMIIKARRYIRFRDILQLRRIGITALTRISPFITLKGKRASPITVP